MTDVGIFYHDPYLTFSGYNSCVQNPQLKWQIFSQIIMSQNAKSCQKLSPFCCCFARSVVLMWERKSCCISGNGQISFSCCLTILQTQRIANLESGERQAWRVVSGAQPELFQQCQLALTGLATPKGIKNFWGILEKLQRSQLRKALKLSREQ